MFILTENKHVFLLLMSSDFDFQWPSCLRRSYQDVHIIPFLKLTVWHWKLMVGKWKKAIFSVSGRVICSPSCFLQTQSFGRPTKKIKDFARHGFLVGWANPSEQTIGQIEPFPQIGMKKNSWNHHLEIKTNHATPNFDDSFFWMFTRGNMFQMFQGFGFKAVLMF